MTDHGDQPQNLQRAPALVGTAGRSFADAWGAEPPAADLFAVPSDLEAGPPEPTPVGRAATLMATPRPTDDSANAGQTLSVRVTRPMLAASAASNATPSDASGHLTLEIRREGGAFDSNRPPEQIVVTVTLNDVNEQVAVTF